MGLKVKKTEIEVEREIGYKYLQMLSRAETLVPGAGREAIEALLWDANAIIIRADVQSDRVVLDGTLNCQAVYRQGEETSLRALSAKSTISQVTEIPGAQGGMLSTLHEEASVLSEEYGEAGVSVEAMLDEQLARRIAARLGNDALTWLD